MKRPPLHPPDETLVEAARAGDPGAFEQLVQRHFTMVYALAYARCGSRETAEDLAQEVFLRAFLHLGKLQQPRYFGTWLGRITRNLAADWQKSSQRASTLLPTVSLPASDSSIKDTTVSEIREQLDDQTRERLVQEAIAKLPIEQREMVMLHYAEGWSYKEIAERLEKDPTTVSRNLRRALDQIRSLVGESAVSIRPSPRGASRTVAVIGAVGLMSVEAKAALAASTEGAVAAVSTTSFGSSSSSALASFLASLNMPAPVTAVVTAVAGTKGLLIGAASVVAVAGGATYIATTTPPAAPNAVTVAAPAAGPALGGAKYDVDAPGLEGPWLGEGDLPRIGHQRGVFMITRDANGAYAGIFYNADEASGILQLTTISAEGDRHPVRREGARLQGDAHLIVPHRGGPERADHHDEDDPESPVLPAAAPCASPANGDQLARRDAPEVCRDIRPHLARWHPHGTPRRASRHDLSGGGRPALFIPRRRPGSSARPRTC
jgi:RNA polymerase sigma-70 factor (ECF subfamily)